MFSVRTNRPAWESELREEVAQFFPDASEDITVEHVFDTAHRVSINGAPIDFQAEFLQPNSTSPINYDKRNAKLAVYAALSAYTGRRLPWGSLTGIRPTRLLYELTDTGISLADACRTLERVYGVSHEKANLLAKIVQAQKGAVVRDEKQVNLYVHIPFCTSRCTYCSFVTEVVDKRRAWIKPYVDALVDELQAARRFLADNGYRVYSVYIGGGTPTALSAEDLSRVLQAAAYPVEYTCEAGRPDTIDAEKLAVMAANGVTRVSINPQSLVERTLEAIGRKHTVEQFFEAYRQAEKQDFIINTDLIAGLNGETIDDFTYTLDAVAALKPHNITVHTLARKNGSTLTENTAYAANADIERITDYSLQTLTKCGYAPYYLYRQKRMLGNLENVGYTLPGARCVNNITTMEDCMSVFACGAGAISKRVYAGGRIERLANVRDVSLYLLEFAARLEKKHAFFG